MPLYEYKCNDCGEQFEKMIRFSEANAIPTCPKCASLDTQKKLSSIAAMGSSSSGNDSSYESSCSSGRGFS
jgi:putative FmdB family regulatory protein